MSRKDAELASLLRRKDAELASLLRRIREEGPGDRNLGICAAIKDRCAGGSRSPQWRHFRATFPGASEQWPKFSGDRVCPVPYAGVSPFTAFQFTEDLWDPQTAYGADRLELLDHLIAYYERRARGRTREWIRERWAATWARFEAL